MKAVIATTKRPNNFESFLTQVKASAEGGRNRILGYVVVPGPGCWNHGVMIDGPDCVRFLNSLTMALMPAKWNTVPDNDPAVEAGMFIFEQDQD